MPIRAQIFDEWPEYPLVTRIIGKEFDSQRLAGLRIDELPVLLLIPASRSSVTAWRRFSRAACGVS